MEAEAKAQVAEEGRLRAEAEAKASAETVARMKAEAAAKASAAPPRVFHSLGAYIYMEVVWGALGRPRSPALVTATAAAAGVLP